MNHVLVMAGGSGTRFWPESREGLSKQFLDLSGRGPMIAETLRRLAPLAPPGNLWVVAGAKDRRNLSRAALPVPPENVILEPCGKNTAPALALAAEEIFRRDPRAVVTATPADHEIRDVPAFRSVVRSALSLARSSRRIVTIGITPTRPATGYGYIERGAPFGARGKAYEAARFTEKPDGATAASFVRSGRYLWNSGLVVFRADLFRESVARHLPAVRERLDEAFRSRGKGSHRRALAAAWGRIPSVSVDYGILEKEEGILVVPGDFGWSDLGTWGSLHEFLAAPGGNASRGEAVLLECRDVLARTDEGVVAVLGMEGVAVVRSGGAVLVCPLARSEEVKRIVEEVRRRHPLHG
jgi:mannose-1-phosphate guanylyltransferase